MMEMNIKKIVSTKGEKLNCCDKAYIGPFKLNCNTPKFLDGYHKANSADPDQTAPGGASRSSLIWVCIVPNLFFIYMKHFSVVKFLFSNLKGITANFYGVRKFRKIMVYEIHTSLNCLNFSLLTFL